MNKQRTTESKDLLGVPLFPSAVYSYEQAAQHCGLSVSTIRRAIDNGLLRGGKNRVTGRALLVWIERNGAASGRTAEDFNRERQRTASI